MVNYFKLLRPAQWVKNLFVFVPLFFSKNMGNAVLTAESIFAFVIFCIAASSVYVLNDYMDADADRLHPEKKSRPLASGAVSKRQAALLIAFLLCLETGGLLYGAHLFHEDFTGLAATVAVYAAINLLYSFGLKHVAIVDIFIIALGFVLRVLAGGCATGILISQWAVLLTFVLALVLAIGKRRGELVNAGVTGKTRKSLDGYNVQFADIALAMSCTLAVICYVMFTLSPEIQKKFHPRVFYTVLFVVFAFLRYLQQTLVYNRTESPTKIIYRDRYIQVTLLLWLLSFMLLIYFN